MSSQGRLTAEQVARELQRVADYVGGVTAGLLRGHIAALEAEIARKDADTKRLDWLLNQFGYMDRYELGLSTTQKPDGLSKDDLENDRQAIDAAMEDQHAK